jgi:peptidoglycan/xylan/chitin deacetylase (PgdA/CDA1 family)
MRIYNRFFKKGIPLFIIIAAVVLLLTIGTILLGNGSIPVFNAESDIPIYSVDTVGKKAAITFDCAWGANDIPEILQVLKEADAKATFFFVGEWADKYPDMVRMVALDGHDIANHSYSHLRMGAIDRDRIRSELVKCGGRLEELTGKKPDLFRAPYGDYSNNVLNMARELGYYTIQWDVDTLT